MVRVHGVGVVGGHHEAVGQQRAVLHVAAAERGAHAAQHILKEAGIRALLRPAADLFVVEHAEHRGALAVGGVEQAAQAAVNALEVVKPCGGDELVLRAPDAAAFARVEDQVAREQRVLGDTEALRDDGLEAGFQLRGADERQHIDVRVVALAVVGASVHMYCDVRYDREVAVDVHESGHHSPALCDYSAPRDGEGAVEPRGAQHPAVFFNIEHGVHSGCLDVRVPLDLERRRIAVRGHDHEAAEIRLRQAQRDNGGTVAADVVLARRGDAPVVALEKLRVAGGIQLAPDVLDRVISAGARGDKVYQLFIYIIHGDSP